MARAAQSDPVRRRRVFYIPGYDPIHPRRYRELYRKEGAQQAEISGYSIGLKPKTTKGPYGWHVQASMDEADVAADVEVLVWSDIVRNSMSTSIAATYWQLAVTAWTYIGYGVLRRLMRLRKGPVIAALYPVGMLLAQLLCAYVVGATITGVLNALRPEWTGPVGGAVAGIFGILAFVALLRWFKSKDGKFFAYYLMHDYAYSARWKGANPVSYTHLTLPTIYSV